MIRIPTFKCAAFSFLLSCNGYAQELVAGQIEVAQFGVAREATYVFCLAGDCPQRSIKHMQRPVTASLQPLPSVSIQKIEAAEGAPIKAASIEESKPLAKKSKVRKKQSRKLVSKVTCKPSP